MNFIIANWKMDLGLNKGVDLAKNFKKLFQKESLEKTQVVICPPHTHLFSIKKVFLNTNIVLGAQNVFWESQGDFTGEISPQWLANLGCKFVILGHSERRLLLGEDYNQVHKKIIAALNHNLCPIVCVGETRQERDKGLKEYVILNQLETALSGIDLGTSKILIAYEPVWAIGSGLIIDPEEIEYMSRIILQKTIDLFSEKDIESQVYILYGGSVDEDNVESFIKYPTIEGALIGGASLKAQGFLKICQKANKF